MFLILFVQEDPAIHLAAAGLRVGPCAARIVVPGLSAAVDDQSRARFLVGFQNDIIPVARLEHGPWSMMTSSSRRPLRDHGRPSSGLFNFLVSSSAFWMANPEAVLSKTHQAGAPVTRFANWAANPFTKSAAYRE
jgi:hypothetical protein